MKIKIKLSSLFVITLLFLIGFFPLMQAEEIENEKKVTITTTYNIFSEKREGSIEVSEDELLEIEKDIERLSTALKQGNEQLIQEYQSILIHKGILKNKIFNSINKVKNYIDMFSGKSTLTNQNRTYYVEAKGRGDITFTKEEKLQDIEMNIFNLMVDIFLYGPFPWVIPPLVFLGFIFLSLMPIHNIIHIIPFRLNQPKIWMRLFCGNCSVIGPDGSQNYTADYDRPWLEGYLYGFCGITINIITQSLDGNEYLRLYLLGYADNISLNVVP